MQEKKFYLTKEGLEKIKKEYRDLKKIKLSRAGEESPRVLYSEDLDSEYVIFYEDLNLLESRVNELDGIIKNAELIKSPKKRNIIDLGAAVLVEVGGKNDEFTIVGSLEANPSLGKISDESPVGKALIGKKVGDKVLISSPIKTFYKIKRIKYRII